MSSLIASATVTPSVISRPTVSTKKTTERTHEPHTAPSVNSRVQLSSPAQSSEMPPISPTRERLIRMM